MKTCSTCKKEKNIEEFNKESSSPSGISYICKECARIKSKKYQTLPGIKDKSIKRSSERRRERREIDGDMRVYERGLYLKRYWPQLTAKEAKRKYDELFTEQNGLCKICNAPESSFDKRCNKIKDLSVDHCHETGVVRGLLCHKCNIGIGALQDNIAILNSAINYLNQSRSLEKCPIQPVDPSTLAKPL